VRCTKVEVAALTYTIELTSEELGTIMQWYLADYREKQMRFRIVEHDPLYNQLLEETRRRAADHN
jgi:hypothetical protein